MGAYLTTSQDWLAPLPPSVSENFRHWGETLPHDYNWVLKTSIEIPILDNLFTSGDVPNLGEILPQYTKIDAEQFQARC